MSLTFFSRWGDLIMSCIGVFIGNVVCAALLVSHYQARIATMERDQAQAVATARAADIETLQLAKRQGDTLTARLQVTESTLTKKQKELQDAITHETTGRACLSGAVVRLLNADSPGGIGVPPPPAGAAAAGAATAADTTDTAFASDTAVAQWAAVARTQFEICRARLDALIDFYPPSTVTR